MVTKCAVLSLLTKNTCDINDHQILVQKLDIHRLCPNITKLISFLSDRRHVVRFKNSFYVQLICSLVFKDSMRVICFENFYAELICSLVFHKVLFLFLFSLLSRSMTFHLILSRLQNLLN